MLFELGIVMGSTFLGLVGERGCLWESSCLQPELSWVLNAATCQGLCPALGGMVLRGTAP